MSQVTTTKERFRSSPPIPLAQTHYRETYPNGSLASEIFYPDPIPSYVPFACYESLTSTGHRGPPYKEGGPFILKRFTFTQTAHQASFGLVLQSDGVNNGYSVRQVGPTIAAPDIRPYIGVPEVSPTNDWVKGRFSTISLPATPLETWGATGIARYKPLNPAVSLGQAIAELREGLPNLPIRLRRQLGNFLSNKKIGASLEKPGSFRKDLGSIHLAQVFGFEPLIKDLQGMYNTWLTIDSLISQIVRDNNKRIRRGGTLYKNVTTDHQQIYGNGMDPYPPIYSVGVTSGPNYTGKCVKTTTTSERIWFKGAFRYYIPDIPRSEWTKEARRALFGLNPSPSLLYEILPWSWLIDWFSNVGDVISNLSSNGIAELIIDYAYVMREVKTTITYTISPPEEYIVTYSGHNTVRRPITGGPFVITEEYVTKERVAATPFGFGLQIADLSDRQLAILNALALSRTNFST